MIRLINIERRNTMKQIYIIVSLFMIVVIFSSCTTELTFKGNHFGDSIEEIQKNEGDNGEIAEYNDHTVLIYHDVQVHDHYNTFTLTYVFSNNELKHIMELINYFDTDDSLEEAYDNIKKDMEKYGSPKIESKEDTVCKAIWETEEHSIVLLAMGGSIIISYGLDNEKSKNFYDTYQFSDLFG